MGTNLFHDIMSWRSVTCILHLINKTHLDWFSKNQATVEIVTYMSAFIAARTYTTHIMDTRTTIRYFNNNNMKLCSVIINTEKILYNGCETTKSRALNSGKELIVPNGSITQANHPESFYILHHPQ